MAWTACDVRPRDPGKSVGPNVIKIGTWVHFGE